MSIVKGLPSEQVPLVSHVPGLELKRVFVREFHRSGGSLT